MRILTALHRSEYAEIVLEHGLDQAASHAAAELHFVTVVADGSESVAAREWLEELVHEDLDAFGIHARRAVMHVRSGGAAVAIASLAAELEADLLVIGRFHVPSESDRILDLVACPTLVVGIEGHILEPQCAACRDVRHATDGDQLFCEAHSSDRMPSLMTRLPLSAGLASRLW